MPVGQLRNLLSLPVSEIEGSESLCSTLPLQQCFILPLVPTQCSQGLMVDHWHCAGCLQDWVEATLAHSSPDSRPSFWGQCAMPAKCMETLEMQDRPQGGHKILCCLDGKGKKRLVSDSSSLFLKGQTSCPGAEAWPRVRGLWLLPSGEGHLWRCGCAGHSPGWAISPWGVQQAS